MCRHEIHEHRPWPSWDGRGRIAAMMRVLSLLLALLAAAELQAAPVPGAQLAGLPSGPPGTQRDRNSRKSPVTASGHDAAYGVEPLRRGASKPGAARPISEAAAAVTAAAAEGPRVLLETPQGEVPTAPDGPCPGPLAAGGRIVISRNCELVDPPPTLERPGATMVGLSPANFAESGSLLLVTAPSDPRRVLAVQPGACVRACDASGSGGGDRRQRRRRRAHAAMPGRSTPPARAGSRSAQARWQPALQPRCPRGGAAAARPAGPRVAGTTSF